mmetsp:Transcript_26985/g.64423  ORF Transcript_26985/g.64423 Transcript_26985/m.64423 type:complete len:86 (-) Transcript_26985:53-310(-)
MLLLAVLGVVAANPCRFKRCDVTAFEDPPKEIWIVSRDFVALPPPADAAVPYVVDMMATMRMKYHCVDQDDGIIHIMSIIRWRIW